MRECKLCNPDEHFRVGEIDRVLYRGDDFYVAIPRDPAMKDHLLVVSKEHVEDITQIEKQHWRMLSKMIIVSAVISKKLKELDGTIKKVYLLCEGETSHLHFHLKPRMGPRLRQRKRSSESRPREGNRKSNEGNSYCRKTQNANKNE